MSHKVFVTVQRGMTDATPVCVFPWEVDVLRLVHGDQVEEVSIDKMCEIKGHVRVEKQKQKHTKVPPPDTRAQLQAMAYVAPEDDPAQDPAAEYDRLVGKYGMDKEFPMPCVERVYGQFTSGAFTAKLKEHAKDRMEKPEHLGAQERAQEDDDARLPADMSRDELRIELKNRGISFKATEGRAALAAKLEAALEPA